MKHLKLYRAHQSDENVVRYGDIIAVDFNHFDSAMGYNLSTGDMFTYRTIDMKGPFPASHLSQTEKDNLNRWGIHPKEV